MDKARWLHLGVIVLVAEKFIQHIVVTLAFAMNWADMRSTVVVNPHVLMVAGAIVALLFLLAFWAIQMRQPWAIDLIIFLALFDIVGEFVAQGRVAILFTVSFLVAIVLLLLAFAYRHRWRASTHPS
jgi:hypothetical protein